MDAHTADADENAASNEVSGVISNSVSDTRNEKEMKRWIIAILLLLWVGVAGAQTTPPMCSITGNVANPDGSPYVGVIKFDSSIVQIINNIPINPIQVSTATSPAGVINPISMPQGLFVKVTMCPNASSSSGCAATFTAIVPASTSANFGNMAMGTNLINPSIITSSLSVTGNTSIGGTLSVTGNTTLANTTINPTLLLPNGVSSSIYWGSLTTPLASITAYSPAGLDIAAGAHVVPPGTWIADAATATIESHESSGAMGYYYDTGLTVGSPYTPTEIGYWGSNGLVVRGTLWAQSPQTGANANGDINNNVQFSVANGGNQALAALCSGAFIVTDLIDGDTALYMCGGAGCVLGPQSIGSFWVASNITPPAGHASVAWNSGSNQYTLFNNQGSTVSFLALTLCSRAGT